MPPNFHLLFPNHPPFRSLFLSVSVHVSAFLFLRSMEFITLNLLSSMPPTLPHACMPPFPFLPSIALSLSLSTCNARMQFLPAGSNFELTSSTPRLWLWLWLWLWLCLYSLPWTLHPFIHMSNPFYLWCCLFTLHTYITSLPFLSDSASYSFICLSVGFLNPKWKVPAACQQWMPHVKQVCMTWASYMEADLLLWVYVYVCQTLGKVTKWQIAPCYLPTYLPTLLLSHSLTITR